MSSLLSGIKLDEAVLELAADSGLRPSSKSSVTRLVTEDFDDAGG